MGFSGPIRAAFAPNLMAALPKNVPGHVVLRREGSPWNVESSLPLEPEKWGKVVIFAGIEAQ